MIDFRYHLVTIIAIFLALAIGIVVGTTALNGAVVTNLHHNVARLQGDDDKLTDARASAGAQVKLGAAYAALTEPALVAGRLRGRAVAIVGLPGTTSGQRDTLASLLRGAGARVQVQVGLADSVVAPTQQSLLGIEARDLAPAGVTLAAGASATQALCAVLAGALTASAADTAVVVSGLGPYFLADDLPAAAAASLIVVLAPPGPASPPASTSPRDRAEQSLVADLVTAFAATARATELAGPASAAAPGGLIAAARSAVSRRARLVTVDGTDQPAGQVAVVLALLAAGRSQSGNFGVTPGDSPLPSHLLASSLPSPSVTPSP